jgi:putative ABC transport system permease protein
MGLDRAVFIPLSSAYQMAEESGIKAEQALQISPSQISAVLIKLKPENQGGLPASRAAFELEQKIPELSILQPGDLSNKLGQNLSMVLRDLSSASYAIWTATALLIALVFAMATNERKREIGILRSLGATRWFIFRMIIIEGILIGLSGSILGLIVSTGLILGFSSLISQSLAIPFFQPQASQLIPVFLIALCLALLTGSVAALYPALRVSQLEPYQAIRSGE